MVELEESKFLGKTKYKFQTENLIISDVEYHEPVTEDWHRHHNLHVSLYLQGGNNEVREKSKIKAIPGKLILYNKNELHRNLDGTQPTKILNIEFKDNFFSNYDINFVHFDRIFISNPDIRFSILKIYNECMIDDLYSENSIYLSLLNLFKDQDGPCSSNIKNLLWLDRLHEILHDRWDEFVSLAELSYELNVHPITISKYFPRYFNCTLAEYMRKIKVEKAIELIKKPHSSLSEISNVCGFSDQSHFIRTFKEFTGFNPGGFRRL